MHSHSLAHPWLVSQSLLESNMSLGAAFDRELFSASKDIDFIEIVKDLNHDYFIEDFKRVQRTILSSVFLSLLYLLGHQT